MSSWARIVILAVSLSFLAFSFEAKAISPGDQNENQDGIGDENQDGIGDNSCNDQIAGYQRAVNACLDKATDLHEARDCWSAQP
jgi:hypothetical protein